MKNSVKLLLMALTAACLLSCKRDRNYVENIYRTHQMSEDLTNNRDGLYRASFVGVHNVIENSAEDEK